VSIKKAPASRAAATGARHSSAASRTKVARPAQRATTVPDAVARSIRDAERIHRVTAASRAVERAMRDIDTIRRAIESPVARALEGIERIERMERAAGFPAVARAIEDAERVQRIVEPPGLESFQRLLRQVDEMNAQVLLSDSSTWFQRLRAALYLAMGMVPPTTSKNPSAKTRARTLARREGHGKGDDAAEWSRRKHLVPALLLAAREKNTPQPVRLSRGWVNHSMDPVVPAEFPMDDQAEWLRIRAQGMAEEWFSEKPRKQETPVPLGEVDPATLGVTGALDLDMRRLLEVVRREGLMDTFLSILPAPERKKGRKKRRG
jgi:hypothetical protein